MDGGARRAAPAWAWIATFALLLATTLSQTRPYIGDESFYQVSAVRMVQTGDMLVPVFFGQPRFQKPILPYWITAAGQAWFGGRLWSGRVGFLVLACVLLWTTGAVAALGQTGRDRRTLAVALLASLTPFIEHARVAVTDLPLTCFSMLSLYAGLRSLGSTGRERHWALAASVFGGLACASKGPLGLLPLLAISLWLWRTRPPGYRASIWRLLHPVNVIVLATLGFAWYGWVFWRHGDELRAQFAVERAANLPTGFAHVPGHALYYAAALLVYSLPWAVLAGVAAWRRRARPERHTASRSDGLGPVAWYLGLTAVAIVFGLRDRNERYLLPLMPGLAACAAAWVEARGWSGWVRVASGALVLAHVAFFTGYRVVVGEPLADLVRAWEKGPAGAIAAYRLPERETGWLLTMTGGRLTMDPATARYAILDERSHPVFTDERHGYVRVIRSARTLRGLEWRGWRPSPVYRTYLLAASGP